MDNIKEEEEDKLLKNVYSCVLDEESPSRSTQPGLRTLKVIKPKPPSSPTYLCTCLLDDDDNVELTARQHRIFTTVFRTEEYLRIRRIPELIRFLLSKVLAHLPNKPMEFLEKLLNDCMLFRAGHGLPPLLYENRHLEAVVKSFDPGERGWMSAGQVRRAYFTLGLTAPKALEDKIPTDAVLDMLKKAQESELHDLLSAGTTFDDGLSDFGNCSKSSTNQSF